MAMSDPGDHQQATVLTFNGPSDGPKLGRLPAKSDIRALMFAKFAAPPRILPKRTNFWPRRAAFPLRSFGNTQYGDCTRAKQAVAVVGSPATAPK